MGKLTRSMAIFHSYFAITTGYFALSLSSIILARCRQLKLGTWLLGSFSVDAFKTLTFFFCCSGFTLSFESFILVGEMGFEVGHHQFQRIGPFFCQVTISRSTQILIVLNIINMAHTPSFALFGMSGYLFCGFIFHPRVSDPSLLHRVARSAKSRIRPLRIAWIRINRSDIGSRMGRDVEPPLGSTTV